MSILVTELLLQIGKAVFPAEIILIDDASNTEFQEINKKLSTVNKVRYVQLKNNIGRSKIRNLFLSYSKFEYLLFLDCDSQVIDSEFINRYVLEINKKEFVVCGGRSYPTVIPPKKYYLRWSYGIERECLSASRRGQRPHQSFMTNNFVVQANMLKQIMFDERLNNYGHEDTLFGYRLKQNKIPIIHINNPVQHGYNETNSEFLKKTEHALKNLIEIRKFMNDKEFDNELKILRIYIKTSCCGLRHILGFTSFVFLPLITRLIKKNIGGLYLFDFYKLLYFVKHSN